MGAGKVRQTGNQRGRSDPFRIAWRLRAFGGGMAHERNGPAHVAQARQIRPSLATAMVPVRANRRNPDSKVGDRLAPRPPTSFGVGTSYDANKPGRPRVLSTVQPNYGSLSNTKAAVLRRYDHYSNPGRLRGTQPSKVSGRCVESARSMPGSRKVRRRWHLRAFSASCH